jgi:hypothetical protein
MRKTQWLVLMVLAVVITGCGGSSSMDAADPESPPSFAAEIFYKASGSLQCSPTMTTDAELEKVMGALKASGINVTGGTCGTDGLAHIALCGAATGDIWLISTKGTIADLMRPHGFSPVVALPTYQSVGCSKAG